MDDKEWGKIVEDLLPRAEPRRGLQLEDPKKCVAPLKWIDGEGRNRPAESLLRDAYEELYDLWSSHVGRKPSGASYVSQTLIHCIASVLDQLEGARSDLKLVHRDLLFIGFGYALLTMPTRKEIAELRQPFLSDLRRRRGPASTERKREEGREFMRARAKELWDQDREQELRITDMALRVIELVTDEAAVRLAHGDRSAKDYWPKGIDTVRDIIRPVAPDYACRKGRPRKK